MRYPITPVPKPRQTRSDQWKKRPCVMRYRTFADKCRDMGIKLPERGAMITFFIPMPAGWSKKKKDTYFSAPHQQKPDLKNLLAALEDAVCPNDERIWHYSALRKIWADEGAIEIE